MANTVIAHFAEPIIIRRHSQGQWVNGYFTEAAPPVDMTIMANVQPFTLNMLQTDVTQAAQKTRDAIIVYSDVPLLASDEDTATNFDLVLYNGRTFTVTSVEKRGQIPSLAHYKSTAMLTDS